MDIGWLAGIIEGEGTIRVRKKPWNLQIGVNMTDADVIQRLREVTGVGTVTGPRDRGGGRKPQWFWSVTYMDHVLWLLGLIEPLMGERRSARIEEAREHATTRKRQPARCGTVAGYKKHLRLGEETCRMCRDAINAEQRKPGRRATRAKWRARTGKH